MKGKIFMEKKFVLTEETCSIDNRTLYRIKAIKNFNNIKKGELGGFVEKEDNLSQEGICWIYDDACVYDDAGVFGKASIHGNARIWGHAIIQGNVSISGNAQVYGCAYITGNANIFNNAHVCGDAYIYDDAHICGNAYVCGGQVYECAFIRGNAYICDRAEVCGHAHLYGNAYVGGRAIVQFSRLNTDLRKDIKASLRCQCNLMLDDGKVIAYKIVNKNLSSLYDENFIYKVGETAICENPREDDSSCSEGLHFSYLTYWDNRCDESLEDLVYLRAEINLEDIITVQEGKLRCRKAKILSKHEIL
jgi:carbonic anhydrase/acetyltransferase-like protein (isoleucine patch superfamily)